MLLLFVFCPQVGDTLLTSKDKLSSVVNSIFQATMFADAQWK